MAAAETSHNHPYVPKDLDLQGFVPILLPASTIIGKFVVVHLLVISLVWIISGRFSKISKIDRLLMCWWVFTGLIHMIVEGAFVFSPNFYKLKAPSFLEELWKEYSKGDSRYAARDPGVVAVEGITTVLEGPASFLAVYAIATRKPYSHILQFATCLGQLYGVTVYYITSILEGDHFAASPYYYVAYYVGTNSVWIVIPTLIVIRCWKKICEAFHVQSQIKSKTR